MKGYDEKMKKSVDKHVNDVDETHDHEQLNCGHGLSNERPHSIDACCQNKPDSEDVLGTETAGLDSESCKLVTACIEQQPAGNQG